jgi:Ca-activated chloride channel family protein
MTFAYPKALFLLTLLIPFLLLAIYNFRKKRILLTKFISKEAQQKLAMRSGKEIDVFKTTLLILAFVFFILAVAGPRWGEMVEKSDIKGIEMMFLLDTSFSMLAEDVTPNRLEVAQHLISNVVDTLKTDYIGLINFAGSAYIQCPLTIDYEAFKLMTDASTVSPLEEQGTDFGKAFQLAVKSFQSSSGNKLIVLITDGEDQENSWKNHTEDLKNQNITVFTVGIGKPYGAPIPVKDKQGTPLEHKKDKQGNYVSTKLDETTLIQIASQLNGQYFRISSITAIEDFAKSLKGFEKAVISKQMKARPIERYYYPLLIGIILLILEFFLSERKLSWKEN